MPNFFIPIQKVDQARHEVWGWGILEEPDQAQEIMDFESSRRHFDEWSGGAYKRSGGKSYGNLRSMHTNIAAGKLIDFKADDARKGFYVGAQVVDDAEWKKVEQGVYTGFSVGGSYVRRWPDARQPGLIRYTAKPTELSLVDAPCVQSATFQMVKMDGTMENKQFHPTNGENVLKAEDDLEKQMPGVPEPVATMAAGDKPQGPFQVDQIPNQFVPTEIKPGAEPEQAVLQTHAVNSADISAEFEKWMPKLQRMMKEVVAVALGEALDRSMVTVVRSDPGASKPDNTRIIKVVRSERNG